MSSPLTLPSEIGVSPCRPEMVPVNLPPSAFRLKVVSRVDPSRAGIWATHLPLTSAAQAAETRPATKSEAATNAVLSFIEESPSEFLICRAWIPPNIHKCEYAASEWIVTDLLTLVMPPKPCREWRQRRK